MSQPKDKRQGMLTSSSCASMVAQRRDRDRRRRLHRPLRPAARQALRRRDVRRGHRRGRRPRLRLPAHRRHGDGAGARATRFANWELGYGDFHLVPDLGTLRVASWLDKTAFVLCDLKNEKTHEYVAVAPRSILRRQIDAGESARLRRASPRPSSSTTSSARATAKPRAQGYRDLEPAGWYLEDYHMLQGTRTEDFHAAVRRHLKHSGVPVENSKGEWGRASTRSTCATPKRSRWPTATSSSSSA